jgi:hypothetical protein
VHFVVLTQDPVHGRDRSKIADLVEKLGLDGGRCFVDVLVAVRDRPELLALHLREGPGLGGGDSLGLGRWRGLRVPAVVASSGFTQRRAWRLHAHDRCQLCDRLVDHLVSPLSSSALSVASCSNSAESFP